MPRVCISTTIASLLYAKGAPGLQNIQVTRGQFLQIKAQKVIVQLC